MSGKRREVGWFLAKKEKRRSERTWEWRWNMGLEENRVKEKSREKILREIQKRGLGGRKRGGMKRGEKRGWKEKKEKDRLYRLFLRFGTPPIIFLAALIVTTSLLSSTSGKLRGMNAPLRSPVGVSGSSSPPDPSGSLMRRLREKIGRESTRHPTPPGIFFFSCSPLSFSLAF